MADVSTSTTPGDSSGSEGGIWRGLRSLIFGEDASETLRERIEEVIAAHEDENDAPVAGDLSPIERKMLRNILHFGERDAGDMGVPRADIVALEENTPFADVVKLFAEAGHSRLPVYREKLDTIVGMVHIKDVFTILATGAEPPETIAELIREPLYVPMSRGALDLLADMRQKRVHLAVVLDEYSGTEGLVTIEDLIEEIVGDIEDEHDDAPQALLVPLEGGGWDVDARVPLEDVAKAVDERLDDEDAEVDTLGGYAALLAGRVPPVGECIDHRSGWKLEVTEADERRIHRLRLHPPASREVDED